VLKTAIPLNSYISELPFGTCSQKAENSKKTENSKIAERVKKKEFVVIMQINQCVYYQKKKILNN